MNTNIPENSRAYHPLTLTVHLADGMHMASSLTLSNFPATVPGVCNSKSGNTIAQSKTQIAKAFS